MKRISFIQYYAGKLIKSPGIRNNTLRPVIAIALAGIVLGICAMLLSVMVVTGFRNEITGKVTGFAANFRISGFSTNNSFEEEPVLMGDSLKNRIRNIEGVRHLQAYANKAGILKTENDIQGVVLKGAGQDYDWTFFTDKLTEGHLPHFSDSAASTEVLLSDNLAKKLRIKCGDSFLVFFIHRDRKVRKLKACGIYRTGLSEDFDNLYLICDLNLIQQINQWKKGEAGGYEVFLDKAYDDRDVFPEVYKATGYMFNTQSTRELYPQMFNWLELQNLNVIVIIGLISLVAGFTMLSTLFIIVMKNSREIGILKTLGARDRLIGSIFGYIAFRLLITGLVIGNILVFILAFAQWETGFLKLPEESYYLSEVPFAFSPLGWMLINLLVLLTGLAVMILPAKIISRIEPAQVMRFE